MIERTFISHSAEETEAFGAALAAMTEGHSVIALFGDLGAGKTALTRGIAAALGCSDSVTSPTYTIVNEYRGSRKLCHFDMYRIGSADALYDIGWDDYLSSGALCVVEWSENIEDALPPNALRVHIEKIDDTTRKIKVTEC